MVIDAEKVVKRFGERTIVKDFNLRVTRGDRIGVVGANGTGKTTLLKLLTGELDPDEGRIRRAKTLDGVIIDQQRKLLDPDRTRPRHLADGGDWVEVRGRAQARSGLPQGVPVRAAAGGCEDRHSVGRRALAAAAGARIRPHVEPAGARRADQRPRSRDARPPPGSDRRL
jgi:ATPase subunit of ABC transporter with duplicated ATPase domains